jgi:hypothetical protein
MVPTLLIKMSDNRIALAQRRRARITAMKNSAFNAENVGDKENTFQFNKDAFSVKDASAAFSFDSNKPFTFGQKFGLSDNNFSVNASSENLKKFGSAPLKTLAQQEPVIDTTSILQRQQQKPEIDSSSIFSRNIKQAEVEKAIENSSILDKVEAVPHKLDHVVEKSASVESVPFVRKERRPSLGMFVNNFYSQFLNTGKGQKNISKTEGLSNVEKEIGSLSATHSSIDCAAEVMLKPERPILQENANEAQKQLKEEFVETLPQSEILTETNLSVKSNAVSILENSSIEKEVILNEENPALKMDTAQKLTSNADVEFSQLKKEPFSRIAEIILTESVMPQPEAIAESSEAAHQGVIDAIIEKNTSFEVKPIHDDLLAATSHYSPPVVKPLEDNFFDEQWVMDLAASPPSYAEKAVLKKFSIEPQTRPGFHPRTLGFVVNWKAFSFASTFVFVSLLAHYFLTGKCFLYLLSSLILHIVVRKLSIWINNPIRVSEYEKDNIYLFLPENDRERFVHTYLEMFLKIQNLPYEVIYTDTPSPRGDQESSGSLSMLLITLIFQSRLYFPRIGCLTELRVNEC